VPLSRSCWRSGIGAEPIRPSAAWMFWLCTAATTSAGVERAAAGSIASEVVNLLGARNVVGKDSASRTIVEVSPEQLLAWQPDVILAIDRRFHAAIRTDPVWREFKAARAGNTHRVPALPFSWLDDPPAPNRLTGLLWLGKLLRPAFFPQDIRAEARRFYALFYQQELSARAARRTSRRSTGMSVLALSVTGRSSLAGAGPYGGNRAAPGGSRKIVRSTPSIRLTRSCGAGGAVRMAPSEFFTLGAAS
jgi:hypothetical protein